MIRISCVALILLAAPLAAQDAAPKFDPQVLDTCLFDTQVEDHENCIGVAADQCMQGEGGGSTVGMTQCLGEELKIWDAKLNETYGDLLATTEKADGDASDADAESDSRAPLLKDMQRKWIAYRDAACAFDRSQWSGGTGAGPAGVQCSLSMTAKQALRLDGYQ